MYIVNLVNIEPFLPCSWAVDVAIDMPLDCLLSGVLSCHLHSSYFGKWVNKFTNLPEMGQEGKSVDMLKYWYTPTLLKERVECSWALSFWWMINLFYRLNYVFQCGLFLHVMGFFRLFPLFSLCPIYFYVIGQQVKKYISLLCCDKNILSFYVNKYCI